MSDEETDDDGRPLARTACAALGLQHRETLTRGLLILIEPGRLLHLGSGSEALVPDQISDAYRALRREQAAAKTRQRQREWDARQRTKRGRDRAIQNQKASKVAPARESNICKGNSRKSRGKPICHGPESRCD